VTDRAATPASPEQVSLAFAQAITAQDLDAAAGSFAEDACFLTAEGHQVRGRHNIRSVLEQLLVKHPRMEVEIDSMIVVGSTAVGSEHWRMHFEPDGHDSFEISGTSTVMFRQSERGWELCLDAPWGLSRSRRPGQGNTAQVIDGVDRRKRPTPER
jgi:uncharacterized protein (TIGR02246 family)